MPGVRIADRLADAHGEQSLVAGVGQRVDGLWEHAGWSSVDPSQELEEEIQSIAGDQEKKDMMPSSENSNNPIH